MTFIIANRYRIKSTEIGGFILQKKIGKQWKEARYFDNLASAVKDLTQIKIHSDTLNIVINETDKINSAIQKLKLIQVIEGVFQEIVEVFSHDNS